MALGSGPASLKQSPCHPPLAPLGPCACQLRVPRGCFMYLCSFPLSWWFSEDQWMQCFSSVFTAEPTYFSPKSPHVTLSVSALFHVGDVFSPVLLGNVERGRPEHASNKSADGTVSVFLTESLPSPEPEAWVWAKVGIQWGGGLVRVG